MKVAVALSQDDVVEVVKRTNAGAIESEERWSKVVARPAILLATSTMPHLSAGFGIPLAYLAVLFFVNSLANFVGLVHLINFPRLPQLVLHRHHRRPRLSGYHGVV